MLHVCVRKFDVTATVEFFLVENGAWRSAGRVVASSQRTNFQSLRLGSALLCALPVTTVLPSTNSAGPRPYVLRVWAYVWPCLAHARRRGSGAMDVSTWRDSASQRRSRTITKVQRPASKRLHHELTWDSTMMEQWRKRKDTKDCCLLTGTYMTHDRPPSK